MILLTKWLFKGPNSQEPEVSNELNLVKKYMSFIHLLIDEDHIWNNKLKFIPFSCPEET